MAGHGGGQGAGQEAVFVLDGLGCGAGGFHVLDPGGDVVFGEFVERDRADGVGDVVADVAAVFVEGVLLDAGEVVDVLVEPVGDGQ